jgi:hypothetical protein
MKQVTSAAFYDINADQQEMSRKMQNPAAEHGIPTWPRGIVKRRTSDGV